MVLLRELPSFRHRQQRGAFRSWLTRIVVNRLRNFWRLSAAAFGSAACLDQLAGCKHHMPLGRKVNASYFV